MTINIDCNCDNCNSSFSDSEPAYCQRCYSDLETEVDNLQTKLDEAIAEKDDLQGQVEQYEQDL